MAYLALSPGRNKNSSLLAAVSGAGATTAVQAQSAGETVPAQTDGSLHKPKTSETPNVDVDKNEDAAAQEASRNGAFTVPYQNRENEVHSPLVGSSQGTSSTRFEQQTGTHSAGTLAQGTPEKRQDGHGVQHSVMEPQTVGQAPKEIPLYHEDGASPGVIEQVQQLAGQAAAVVNQAAAALMSAAGVGEKEGETKTEETKVEDGRVDQMGSAQVEEFLRARHQS